MMYLENIIMTGSLFEFGTEEAELVLMYKKISSASKSVIREK
jgi:hypothetical protein